MKDRTFGLAWCCILSIFSLWPLWRGERVHLPLIVLAALLAGIALVAPRLLAWPNLIWARFGKIMHHVTSAVALIFLYYFFFTPGAALMRLFGRNELRLHFDRDARTYWTDRPPGETDFTRPY